MELKLSASASSNQLREDSNLPQNVQPLNPNSEGISITLTNPYWIESESLNFHLVNTLPFDPKSEPDAQ